MLDGTNKTWWSSAPLTATPDQLVTFDLDLGVVRKISRVQLAWGDDGERPREMSRTFHLSYAKKREVLAEQSAMLYDFDALRGCPKERFISHVAHKTVTVIDLATPVEGRYLRLSITMIPKNWRNHAMHQFQVWGPGTLYDAEELDAAVSSCGMIVVCAN